MDVCYDVNMYVLCGYVCYDVNRKMRDLCLNVDLYEHLHCILYKEDSEYLHCILYKEDSAHLHCVLYKRRYIPLDVKKEKSAL